MSEKTQCPHFQSYPNAVLPDGKLTQTDLTINTIGTQTKTISTTLLVPSDLSIEHTYRQTGKIKQLNISQVRANISANKTCLRKAKKSGTDKQIENILEYWKEWRKELIEAAAVLVHGAKAG